MHATVVDRRVIAPSPGKGIASKCSVYACDATGLHLQRMDETMSRSDTIDAANLRWSDDNGRTWSDPVAWAMRFDPPEGGGTGRRHPRGGYVDPMTGRYLMVWTEGVLPTDDPLEGMRRWTLHHKISTDGGRTATHEGQIIHEGTGYDATHHLPGVTVGKSCVMSGDLGERLMTRSDGVILFPAQVSHTDSAGNYHNPFGKMTFTDCIVLLGRWRNDGSLAWTCGQRVVGDPARSTRGWIEPTLAQLDNGDLMMIMRGSNLGNTSLPARRWQSLSRNGGMTWSDPRPWTYDDGEPFYSPSSCSQLLTLRDGRTFWLGNICPHNADGNGPRYPLILGRVDRHTGALLRHTVNIVDDKAADESPYLTLSNFYIREDAETGDLLLYLSRLFANDRREGGNIDWTCDGLEYRITLQE